MKKLFVIAAVTLASGAAFASKARVSALGNGAHLTDAQTIFQNPADMTLWGDWATFEMGTGGPFTYTPSSANTATTSHEGGLVRSAVMLAGVSTWATNLQQLLCLELQHGGVELEL